MPTNIKLNSIGINEKVDDGILFYCFIVILRCHPSNDINVNYFQILRCILPS